MSRSSYWSTGDCGAYRAILVEDFAKDPVKETKIHATTQRALASAIKKQRPNLAVETLLMSLDGKVETTV